MSKKLQLILGIIISVGIVSCTNSLISCSGESKIKNKTPIVKTQTETILPTVVVPEEKKEELNLPVKKILNLNFDSSRTVVILGEINYSTVAVAKKIIKLGNESTEPIYLIITSPGGSVLFGSYVLSAIESSKAPVHTICYGFCASMAAVILEYGKQRYATDRSWIMFHQAALGVDGELENIKSYIKFTSRYIYKTDAYIAKRIGMETKDFQDMIADELWIDSEDAQAKKIIDRIVSFNVENILSDVLGSEEEMLKRFKKAEEEMRRKLIKRIQ